MGRKRIPLWLGISGTLALTLSVGCYLFRRLLPPPATLSPPVAMTSIPNTIDRCPIRADDLQRRIRQGQTWEMVRSAIGLPQVASTLTLYMYWPPEGWDSKWSRRVAFHVSARPEIPHLLRLIYWNPQDGDNATLLLLDEDDSTVLALQDRSYSPWLLDAARRRALIGKTAAEVERACGTKRLRRYSIVDYFRNVEKVWDYDQRGGTLHLSFDPHTGRVSHISASIPEDPPASFPSPVLPPPHYPLPGATSGASSGSRQSHDG